MGRMGCPALFITCLLLYSLFVAVINAHEDEVEDESPFSYDWQSEKGPENWAHLNPKWKACGNGRLQSPIDLVDDRVVVLPKLGNLKRSYKPAPAIIENRGHDISLLVSSCPLTIEFHVAVQRTQRLLHEFKLYRRFCQVLWEGDAGGTIINGTEYKLRQCHWHTPAEHTVDGKSFKMEIHLVHNDSLGHLSVIGILYKLGRPDPFLAKLLEIIKTVNHEGMNVGIVDPWDIKFGSRKYFRYVGSLTVPPCTEGVLWTILKKVRTVSMEQIRALREAVHDGFENNARPTQHSDVAVYMYRPGTPQ